MELVKINPRIAEFIKNNATGLQSGDSAYYHYQQVCLLLKNYEEAISSADIVYGQASGRNENKVVKITHDDEGFKKDSPRWCLVDDVSGSYVAFCTGEAFGHGESIARYEEKQGRITCPECRARIKSLKSVKL